MKLFGEFDASSHDYPFGQRLWYIRGDPCFVGGGERPVAARLSLSACGEAEFNCRDGQCVDMRRRCDGFEDCADRTGKDAEKNFVL